MTVLKCPECGVTHSLRGRLFTPESLAQHRRDQHFKPIPKPPAALRNRLAAKPRMSLEAAVAAVSALDPDAPDGAFWAMVNEMTGEV